ncbi:methyltransferase [Streptomyces polygonati]|uniref:Methyltransferase n=1 Tax=Streptomyces polygonati TaxID=1617087 RepID=A0ABV8HN06_9ACTN
MLDQRQTFQVSSAGRALGKFLAQHLTKDEIAGRVLDLGTGSGAMALMLRAMGATSITATDISFTAVETAQRNELLNFPDSRIDFQVSDVFETTDGPLTGPFDLVVFNPPGWRSPSPELKAQLDTCAGALDLAAMFHGETVLLRFLDQLASRLAPGGRAIVGLNSLVGVSDVLERSKAAYVRVGGGKLKLRVLDRIELPLLLYTEEWASVRSGLLREFESHRRLYGAQYVIRDEMLYWYYEITELTVVDSPDLPLRQQGIDGAGDEDDR